MTRRSSSLLLHVELLRERLDELAMQIRDGDGDVGLWPEYRETALTLVALLPHAGRVTENPERLLTTAELANTAGVSTRTVERFRKQGKIRPRNVIGKSPRWAPDTLTMGPQSAARR